MINTIPASPAAAQEIMKHAYQMRLPLFFWGEPGVGKSELVRDFVNTERMHLVDLRLTTMDAPDLRGLQWINEAEGVTKSYRPEFFPNVDEPGVIFLDELTAAESRMQATTYQLVLDRCVGPHKLPPSWWVIGAGNSPEDGAISYRMGSALADRFVHIHVIPNVIDWVNWAIKKEIHPAVISFIKVKPDFLCGVQGQRKSDQLITPSPRSWARVSDVMQAVKSAGPKAILINGIVGDAAAVEFTHIVEELEDLPSIEELFRLSPDKAAKRVPAKISTLYGLSYSLAAYVHDAETIIKALELIDAVSNIKDKLPRAEIETMTAELLFMKTAKLGVAPQVARSKAYKKYAPKSQQLESA